MASSVPTKRWEEARAAVWRVFAVAATLRAGHSSPLHSFTHYGVSGGGVSVGQDA